MPLLLDSLALRRSQPPVHREVSEPEPMLSDGGRHLGFQRIADLCVAAQVGERLPLQAVRQRRLHILLDCFPNFLCADCPAPPQQREQVMGVVLVHRQREVDASGDQLLVRREHWQIQRNALARRRWIARVIEPERQGEFSGGCDVGPHIPLGQLPPPLGERVLKLTVPHDQPDLIWPDRKRPAPKPPALRLPRPQYVVVSFSLVQLAPRSSRSPSAHHTVPHSIKRTTRVQRHS